MASYVPNGRQQFCDSNGKPLALGTVGMYVVGTLTPKNTWQDSGASVLNTDPITLDAGGYATIYGSGQYRQIVKDALGNVIYDDVVGDVDSSLRSDLGADTGASLVNFISAGAGAVSRTVQDKLRETVSLRDFGAHLNSVDDDAPAWAALFAAYPTGGITVNINGYCRINSSITPPSGCSNITVDFDGGGYLYNPDHGFDMLVLPNTVAGWNLRRPRFFTDNGASGLTERYMLNNASNDLITEHLWMRNGWSGFFNSGAKVSLLGRTYGNAMKAGSGSVAKIDMVSNEDFMLQDIFAENATGQDCLAGIQLISGGSVIIGGTVTKCGTPLLVNPTTGKVVATLGLWPFFNADTSSANGVQFTGAGTIQRVEGNLRVSSNAGDGLRADISPHSADLQVRAVQNTGNGVNLNSGGTQYNSRYRIAAYGNTLSGLNVANNCTNWSANVVGGSGDDFGGNARYSVEIGTGCDHFDVNASGSGDTLGQLLNGSGTSATKVVVTRN